MNLDMRKQENLKHLRQDLQEDAGTEFPKAVITELSVLYDVGKALELNHFELENMLGIAGMKAVTDHINAPIGTDS